METNSPGTTKNERQNIAAETGMETVGTDSLEVTPDQLPWVDRETTIDTVIISSPNGEFQFGSVIGANNKLQKLAAKEMQGREGDDDRLNRVMYDSIQTIMGGNPGSVKHVRHAPAGTTIYYGGLSNGARVYFVDAGNDEQGRRTFLKAGLCGSKGTEPAVIKTFSGRKTERVK